jgi:hypothetical protein
MVLRGGRVAFCGAGLRIRDGIALWGGRVTIVGFGGRRGGGIYMSTSCGIERSWDVESGAREGMGCCGVERGRTFLVVPPRGGHSCTLTRADVQNNEY